MDIFTMHTNDHQGTLEWRVGVSCSTPMVPVLQYFGVTNFNNGVRMFFVVALNLSLLSSLGSFPCN